MVKYLFDADLPRVLFHALKRRQPGLDVVRVQHVGLRTASDPDILAYAAKENRIVVSRDKATMREFASQFVESGKTMAGLLIVRPGYLVRGAGLRKVVDELLLLAEASDSQEWLGVIQFIPFLFD